MIRDIEQNEQPADDDRLFEAIRYLLDEMTEQEAELFEADLATDQSLRELLAEAVLLTGASHHAIASHTVSMEPVEVASPIDAAPGNKLRLRVLLSLAACLMVFLAGGFAMVAWSGGGSHNAERTVDSENSQLAAAWVEHIEDDTDAMPGQWEELPEDEDAFFDQLLASTPENPPSWMLKALAAQQETESAAPAL
ncbi:hypothetical protein [Bremerella alba]|uniref:Uncharacterized protein n=1 Tax=Bremerella alba TaxID=980252 RepID=A0A7V8V7M0_9BACT|nr:hypothetical protein [Bremerella alba]MBA2116383.1 hypothetical protein [Bremerella alba]